MDEEEKLEDGEEPMEETQGEDGFRFEDDEYDDPDRDH